MVSLVTVTSQFHAMHTTMNPNMAHAIENGNSALVKKILNVKSQVNAKDKDGNTPLHLVAIREGRAYEGQAYREIARLLVEKGAQLNEKNNKGETPLYLALYEESVGTALLIIHAGGNIHEEIKNTTPLCEAVRCGQLEIIQLLLDKGAEITDHTKNLLKELQSKNKVLDEVIQLFEIRDIEQKIKNNQEAGMGEKIKKIVFHKRALNRVRLLEYAYHRDNFRDKQGKNMKEAICSYLPIKAIPFIFSSEPKLEFIRALLLQAREKKNRLFAKNLLDTQSVVTLLNHATKTPLPREIVGKIISFTDGSFVSKVNSDKSCVIS